MMKIFKNLLNVVFVIMVMWMVMLKHEIIVMSLKNIDTLYIEIVISRIN